MSNGIYGSNQTNPYPQAEFLEPSSKRPHRAWQQYFLNLVNFSHADTATSGTAQLPTAPQGFVNMTVNGKQVKVPYYNQ
jgi:hypothetical protein